MNKNIKPGDPEQVYRSRMMAACPVQGEPYKFMIVNLDPGGVIKAHKHKHHAVLYYPEVAEPVIITPQPGTMLYLPPGTIHQVPRVSRQRISIAMLFSPRSSE